MSLAVKGNGRHLSNSRSRRYETAAIHDDQQDLARSTGELGIDSNHDLARQRLSLLPPEMQDLLVQASMLGAELCRRAAEIARRLCDPELLAAAELTLGEVLVPIPIDPVLSALLEDASRSLAAGSSLARAAPELALERDGEVWIVRHGDRSFRLRDSRGLRMLATLLSREGEEIHVTELMGVVPGADGGDAGELLDDRARTAYRARLDELREELRDAEELGHTARAIRAREEIDLLARELGRAMGLGGRSRRAGSAVERARVAVRQRIRDAIQKIGERSPELGRELASRVQTGTFCSYRTASSRVAGARSFAPSSHP